MGKTLVIPGKVDPNQLFLRLGYEDDDYGDNGYSNRDDGIDDQCKGLGNAYVIVTVNRGALGKPPLSPAPLPMDMVWDAVDDNWLPKNPKWGLQVTQPGSLHDPMKLSGGFPLIYRVPPPYTMHAPGFDSGSFWNGFICGQGAPAGKFIGHVNWGAATYEGPIFWDEHSSPGADDDYNFKLVPPGQAGLVVASNGSLGLEFDSDETIDYFTTPWWKSFRYAVDTEHPFINRPKIPRGDPHGMVDRKFAIVTGLLGLDVVHAAHTEIHPVWALAIRVKEAKDYEMWAIFVRNWGNEGYCSQEQHYLHLAENRYTFRLPWRPEATTVSVDKATIFRANNRRTSGPDVSWKPITPATNMVTHLRAGSPGAAYNTVRG